MRSAARIDPTSSPNELASALLALRGRDTLTRLAAQSGGGKPQETVIVGDEAVTRTRFDELTARSVELIREEHGRHPLRPGLPLATLAERIGVSSSTLAAMVDESVDLVRHGPDIAAEDHVPRLTAEQEEAWRGARGRLAESLSVPVESELGLETDLVAFKIRTGELVRVSPELVYLPEQIGEIKTLLNAIDGEFTVADFRDHAGLTRKYAVPVLEWTDKEGLTVRRGDVRRLR